MSFIGPIVLFPIISLITKFKAYYVFPFNKDKVRRLMTEFKRS